MTNTFEPNFLNLEYFFNLIYFLIVKLLFGVGGGEIISPETKWWLKFILALLSGIFTFLIIILARKLIKLRHEEKLELLSLNQKDFTVERVANENWQKILDYAESDNEANWKLAIIEADKILDEMVKKMGYAGEDLGTRLRAVEASDFISLEDAWEAHRIRNKIAHEAGFTLTKREAKRVVGLFEKVFREFDYI
ncbi:MAG: hypothetical protein AAB453_02170 [Patescibacteria group bacterium]